MKRLKKFFLVFLIGVVSVVLTFGTFSVASASSVTNPGNLGNGFDLTQYIQLYSGGPYVAPCFNFSVVGHDVKRNLDLSINYTVCGVIEQSPIFGDESYVYSSEKVVLLTKNNGTYYSTFWIEAPLGDSGDLFAYSPIASGWKQVGYNSVMSQPSYLSFSDLNVNFYRGNGFNFNSDDTFKPTITYRYRGPDNTNTIKWESTFRYDNGVDDNYFEINFASTSTSITSSFSSFSWVVPKGYCSIPVMTTSGTGDFGGTFNRSSICNDVNTYLYLGMGLYNKVQFEQEYDRGYNDGLAVHSSDLTGWNAISSAFGSIFDALDVPVFGYFSLGDVLGVVLVFGVIFFVFKLIRG